MWTNNNSFGNKIPGFLAPQNTVIVQTHAACINEQFSNITEQGYLQMKQMKVKSEATAPAKVRGIMVVLLIMPVGQVLHGSLTAS